MEGIINVEGVGEKEKEGEKEKGGGRWIGKGIDFDSLKINYYHRDTAFQGFYNLSHTITTVPQTKLTSLF